MRNFDWTGTGKQWLIGAFEDQLALASDIGVVFLMYCTCQRPIHSKSRKHNGADRSASTKIGSPGLPCSCRYLVVHPLGIVIYRPARDVQGRLNYARIGTEAVIYPYMDSSRPASRTCIMREG